MSVTRMQRKILVAIFKWHEKFGFQLQIRFDQLARETSLPSEFKVLPGDGPQVAVPKERKLASQVFILNKGDLLEWHWSVANPWYYSSMGRMTPEGVSLAYESTRSAQILRILVGGGVSLGGSAIAALVTIILTPANLEQIAAGIAGGTIGGSLFAGLRT